MPARCISNLLLSAVLLVLGAAVASAQGPAGGAVIITGLSPDAVGHFDADQCRGCDPEKDAAGLCDNTCISCADAGRTFADSTSGGCGQFTDQATCNAAWSVNQTGTPLSCFFHPQSVCVLCDEFSQSNGLCTNTCFPCADAARTTFAGKSFFPDGCRQFDGNQTNCDKGFVLNSFSNVPLSCFFDGTTNECHACEISERFGGQCTNQCATCKDLAHSQLVDEIGGEGCESLAGDEGACTSSWQFENGHVPAPCFFTAGTELNQGGFLFIQDGFDRLGPLVTNGKKLAVCLGCNGTTALDGFNAGFDESILPGHGWTRATIVDPTEIGQFFTGGGAIGVADAGLIYIPSQEADSAHAGIVTDQIAALNANKATLGAFVATGGGLFALNQSRILGGFEWLDAVVPGAHARNGNTCLQQLELTAPGVATFPHVDDPLLETLDDHTSGYFLGTFGTLEVLANGQCRDITCKDAAKTEFIGQTIEFFGDICQLESDEATCNVAWQFGGFAASCDFEAGQCRRCGRTSDDIELCTNTCAGCDDATRTSFASDSVGCEGITDSGECEISWAIGREGLNVSCFFDELAGFCRACETEEEINAECTNTCEPPPGARAVVLGPAFFGPSPNATATSTPEPTLTATVTATVTPVPTLTATPVPTLTATPVPTLTATPLPTLTAAPLPTLTAAPLPTLTAAPTPTITPTPGPVGALPPFQCYEIDRVRVEPIPSVQIADAFGTRTAQLRRPTRLCAPADVNGTATGAPGDPRHLLGYELRDADTRFDKVKHVAITNELGTIDADLVRPVLLMTPALKSRSGDPGAPGAIGLDHFQCYLLTGARTRADDVKVSDQFGTLQVDVKRPFRACIAADKNGGGIIDPTAALLCYRVRPERRPRFTAGTEPIFVHDQFGPREIALTRPTELCLPSTIGAVD